MNENQETKSTATDARHFTPAPGSRSEIVNRLLELLECIEKYPHEEYQLTVALSGAQMEEDERTDLEEYENPGGMFNDEYLGDMETIDTAEFNTDLDAGGTYVSVGELRDLRRILSENDKITHGPKASDNQKP